MGDPLRSLKLLPWGSLFQVSAFTTAVVIALELILSFAIEQSSIIRNIGAILYRPPSNLLMTFIIAATVGALAVDFLERLFPKMRITGGILWALIPCLALLLGAKLLLPIPPILIDLNEFQLMAIPVGVFWRGERYWRW